MFFFSFCSIKKVKFSIFFWFLTKILFLAVELDFLSFLLSKKILIKDKLEKI